MRLKFNINLTPTQRRANELLDNPDTRTLVCKWSRQCGKTVFAVIKLIEFLVVPNTFNVYISPTFSQGRKVFKDITGKLEKVGLIKSANASTLTITTITESTLQFFSAESPTAIRGYTVRGLCVIDEAAFLPDQLADGSDIWANVIYPIIKAHKKTNKTLIISTPNGKRGLFYDFYCRALKQARGFALIEATIYDDNLVSPEEINELKESMPSNAFRQEFLCEFLDSGLTYFVGFEDCFKTIDGHNTYDYLGIDLSAYGEDETILTFIDKQSGDVKQVKVKDATLEGKYNKIADEILLRKPSLTLIERNGIGAPMFDEITQILRAKGFKGKVDGFTTTNASKIEANSKLSLLVDKRALNFDKNDKELYSQFSTFIYKYTKKGTLQLEAMAGHHDDRIMSLAIACEAMKQGNKSGVYSIDRLRPNRKPMDICEKYDNPKGYEEEQEYRKKYMLV